MATPTISPDTSFTFGGYAGTPDGIDGVGFWPRTAARLIDYVVHNLVVLAAAFTLGIVIFIVGAATGNDIRPVLAKIQTTSSLFSLRFLLTMLGHTAYHTICEGLHGSTIGKLLLGQVVVGVEQRPCNMRPAMIRSFGYYVDALCFGAVGYFAMNRTRLQQRYGDDWASTVVCKRSQVAQQNLRSHGRFFAVFILAIAVDSVFVTLGYIVSLF